MGTDIHLYVEQRQTDGTWKRVKPGAWKCSECDGKCTIESGPYHETPGVQIPCVYCEGKGTVRGEYDDRNYDLFGILANVRNGSGFAGVDTGDGFVPIADPRGVPADLSFSPEPDWSSDDRDDEDDDEPYLGDHSFSWVTLAEVLAYDYTRATMKRGCVNSISYAKQKARGGGRPLDGYSGGVSGPRVKHISNEEMDKLISNGITPGGYSAIELAKHRLARTNFVAATDGNEYFTSVQWREDYREAVGEGWFSFMDACKQLGDPEHVRLVFGFDS